MLDNTVFVLDVDGTITDGSMIYTRSGKLGKVFGPDDWCLLAEIAKSIPVHFISADTKGFAITQRRIADECQYPLDLIPSDGLQRWEAIKRFYPNNSVIYMGDGCKDWYPLMMADYSITTCDALSHVKNYARFITKSAGGHRAVAEACMQLIKEFQLPQPSWLPSSDLESVIACN